MAVRVCLTQARPSRYDRRREEDRTGKPHPMDPFTLENVSHDPLHGYIAFVSRPRRSSESAEREVLDHPWVQRLRQIHQLQTAWWVFPTAEHTRFQHVLGAMHLATRAANRLYDSLRRTVPECPSRPYVELLLRMSALLHDVGHGPFGHFFDAHFLKAYHLTHESLGASIITGPLHDLLRSLRETPQGRIGADERLDPSQIAYLVCRPRPDEPTTDRPRWLRMLRSLFCGIYTVDNMDFVLRDAYMSGYNQRAFDLDRLLHYSFFTEKGLTIHARGMDAVMRFLTIRAELFRSLYFHRTVRAIDLELADLFAAGRNWIFPGNPLDHLDAYLHFTEWSLLVDVSHWSESNDAERRELGRRWQRLLRREVSWKMVCQRTVVFGAEDSEGASLLSSPDLLEQKLRRSLPSALVSMPLRLDVARHMHRPDTRGPTSGQNYLYDGGRDQVRSLDANDLYHRLPIAHRICRIYMQSTDHRSEITRALDQILGGTVEDDLTNM